MEKKKKEVKEKINKGKEEEEIRKKGKQKREERRKGKEMIKHMKNSRRRNKSGKGIEWKGREWPWYTEKNRSYTCCCDGSLW